MDFECVRLTGCIRRNEVFVSKKRMSTKLFEAIEADTLTNVFVDIARKNHKCVLETQTAHFVKYNSASRKDSCNFCPRNCHGIQAHCCGRRLKNSKLWKLFISLDEFYHFAPYYIILEQTFPLNQNIFYPICASCVHVK